MPVGTVAAAAHGPGDECTSRHRWTEDDGDESITTYESIVVKIYQTVWQRHGCEISAVSERTAANTGNSIRESEGSDRSAITEAIFTNTGRRFRECDQRKSSTSTECAESITCYRFP